MTPTNRCADCRYWSRYSDKYDLAYHGADRGQCSSPAFVCANDLVTDRGATGKANSDQLCYWDSESYAAGFDTGENFGCLAWAAK